MRIRKHSRITALVLALVMILPLISIPTFAEGEAVAPINWSQNFDNVTKVGDAFARYSSWTTIEDGAFRSDYVAGSDNNFYVTTTSTSKPKSVISNPVWNGNTLTGGTATIDGVTYNVTGLLNVETTKTGWTEKAALTTSDGTAYTANTMYIVSAKSYDALHGGLHVGKLMTPKVPAVSKDLYKKVAVSLDYFISEDVPGKSSFEVTWQANSGRVDIAKLYVNAAGYVELQHHADAGSPKTGYTYLRAPKGQWFTVKALMDISTGVIELYLNGDYGLTIVDDNLKTGLKAEYFNVGQISRGSTPAPSDMKGYLKVDNISVTTDVEVYSSTDFNHYAGISAFRGGTYINNFAYGSGLPSKLTSVTENGNTYLKYNFGADLLGDSNFNASSNTSVDADGDGVVDFQANSGYTRWAKNSQIASYDFDTHVLTLKDGTTYNVTAQGEANVKKGFYGTFKDGETTFRLTSPLYASATQFGDGNVDKNIAVRISPYSYEDYDELYLSAKYLIEPGSSGTAQSQLYQIMVNTSTASTWNGLYEINLETGAFSRGGFLTIGEWNEVGVKFNLDSGDATFYINGQKITTVAKIFGTNISLRKAADQLGNCGWVLAKQFKSEAVLTAKGSICVDDAKVAAISTMPDEYLIKETFNDVGWEGTPVIDTNNAIYTQGNAGSIYSTEAGSQAWKFSYERVGGTAINNIDKNPKMRNPALDYTKAKSIVLETSYFIDANATGKLQSQFQSIKVGTPIPDLASGKYQYASTEDEAAGKFKTKTTATWVDLYCIEFYGSKCYLTREAGTDFGAYEMYTGMWNTISLVVDLETGNVQYYVNGNHAFDGPLNATAGKDVSYTKNNLPYEKVKVDPNQWVVGKVNKVDGKGDIYIDDIKMYEGTTIRTQPAEETSPVYDFEKFQYSDGKSARFGGFAALPSLTTYKKEANGNMALRLDMGAAHTEEGWALLELSADGSVNKVRQYSVAYYEGAKKLTYSKADYTILTDEKNGLPYIMIGDKKCYIVPNAIAEAAAGGSNAAAPLTLSHDTFSYEDQQYVVLAQDLFIEEGSNGIVESQFAGYQYVDGEGATKTGGWLQLFHLHLETGLLTGQGGKDMGVKLEMGKWNNVKVVGDLVDGVFYIYVNGILARTYDSGCDNLTIGETADWIIVKVQRHTNPKGEPYHGGLLIDNISIGVEEYAYSDSYGKQFLTDELFENYTADLLSVVDAASIRFKAPAGLRFGSIVNTEKVEVLKKLYGADKTKMGTIITPADYVTDEYEDEDLDSLQGITREDLDGIDASNNSANVAYLDIAFDGTYFQGDAAVNLEEGADYMVGSIVGLLQSNYERKFAGMGYIEFETENGVIGIYTDMTLRSVAAVANECSVSGAELTEEQIMILECYIMGDELPEEYMPEVEE